MNIDCPHCGVRGSVDDSLAGKKLRCPKCSKVFLAADHMFPQVDDTTPAAQDILHEQEPEVQVPPPEKPEPEELPETEVAVPEEDLVETGADDEEILLGEDSLEVEDAAGQEAEEEIELEEELETELESASARTLMGDDDQESDERLEIEDPPVPVDGEELSDMDLEPEETELGICSECKQSFAPEFLLEVHSRLYCALCQPDSSDEEELILEEDVHETAADEEELLAFAEDGEEGSDQLPLEDTVLETCAGCGESFQPAFLDRVGSRQYCGLCLPQDGEEGLELTAVEEPEGEEDLELKGVEETEAQAEAARTLMVDDVQEGGELEEIEEREEGDDVDFTVGELIKEAWQKTKGAKAAIWGGVFVMYLILFALSVGGSFICQGWYDQSSSPAALGANGLLQMISSWLSMIFTGGLMLIGVRRAFEQRVSWRMVFAGFSGSKIVPMSIAVVLQTFLIMLGFLLLVLPGIYLAVGYALTLPLILDKGLGPWQALETSRKSIHKKWWTVLGIYLVLMLLYLVAIIPLGLGLLWVVPMSFVTVGVLYARFFNASSAGLEEDGEPVGSGEMEGGSEEQL